MRWALSMVQYIGRLRATSRLPYRNTSKTWFFKRRRWRSLLLLRYLFFSKDRNYGFWDTIYALCWYHYRTTTSVRMSEERTWCLAWYIGWLWYINIIKFEFFWRNRWGNLSSVISNPRYFWQSWNFAFLRDYLYPLCDSSMFRWTITVGEHLE